MRPIGENSTKPSNGLNSRPAVVCDFDDTTVLENVAQMLLQEFGGDGWREYQRQNTNHRMSLMRYQELAFSTVTASREAMKALVKERVTLRPHFRSLFEYCRKQNVPLAIASMGLDFYVEALLEREEMESIPFYTVDTQFSPQGINFGYRYTWEQCWQPGNCKCRAIEEYRKKGHSILFAGDGKSDICPATKKSDMVFARRYLEEHFQEQGLSYTQLTDFSPIVNALRAIDYANGGTDLR